MSFLNLPQQQKDPEGKNVNVSVTGTAALSTTLLLANATWSSGWLPRGQYLSAQTTLYATVPGYYTLEYSNDNGETLCLPTITIPYTLVSSMRKGGFDISSEWVRFTYHNNSVAQTGYFYFEIRVFSNPIQPSMETLNALGADTRFALWTKTRIETKDDLGTYDYIGRVDKALRVHVDNPSNINVAATDVSGLAKETGGNLQAIAQTDFATQSTANAILQKLITSPATEATVAQLLSKLNGTIAVSGAFYQSTQPVSIAGTPTVNIGTLPSVEIMNDAGNPIPVSGTVTANVTFPVSQVVTGAFYQTTQPVSLALNTPDVTDRAARLLGHVTIDGTPTVNANVTFPTTQAISAVSLPLATGASTETTLALIKAKTDNLDVLLSTRTKPTDVQAVSVATLPLATGAATSTKQDTLITNTTGLATSAKQDTIIAAINALTQRPSSSTVVAITTTASSAVILVANTNRKGAVIACISGPVYITLNSTSSLTVFTARLIGGGYYEVPFGYTGTISAIGAGSITVTELIP